MKSIRFGSKPTLTLAPLLTTAAVGLGLGREATATLLATELYPLGILTPSPVLPLFNPLSPKPVPSALEKTAILFVHGVLHNRSAFALLKNRMSWTGYREFQEMNLFTTLYSVPRLAKQVAERVETVLEGGRIERIVIVAHSMGGIVARYLLQVIGAPREVDTLITLGTAHQGTYLSQFSLLPHLHDLSPGSELLSELNRRPIPPHLGTLNIYGTHDLILKPKTNARWKGAQNLEVSGVGHLGILFSRRAARAIIDGATRRPSPTTRS